MKISLFYKSYAMKACFVFFIGMFLLSSPALAHAGFFSDLVTKVFGSDDSSAVVDSNTSTDVVHNSQNVPLMESSINPDSSSIKDAPVVNVIEDQALVSTINGPLSPSDDLEKYASSAKINTYMVKKGDTVESIAKKFKVTKNVILYSNADLKKSDLLKIGQTIVILAIKDLPKDKELPATDKNPTVPAVTKKDDKRTLAVNTQTDTSVKTDTPTTKEVAPIQQNTIVNTDTNTNIVNPVPQVQSIVPTVQAPADATVIPQLPQGQPSGSISGGYIWPFPEGVGRVSQGLHADMAYDFAAPKGTPIYAIHDGTVLIAHPTGYNGGYGLYVVINFTDGRQAIFGHMSKVVAKAGDVVKQGDIIGYVGSTGKSTGPHTHIGFHGDLGNPYIGLKVNSTDVENND